MAENNQTTAVAELEATLAGCPAQIAWTKDSHANTFGWLHLKNPTLLEAVAKSLAELKARLITVTAFAMQKNDPQKRRSIAYHFDYKSITITVEIPTFAEDTGAPVAVPSITKYFRNASWNEREFHEMFGIEINGHPNPKRLFLDERLDAGIMSSLIPYSALVHGASSKVLWEKVMEAKVGIQPTTHEEAVVEPPFTPTNTKSSAASQVQIEPQGQAASAVTGLTEAPKNGGEA